MAEKSAVQCSTKDECWPSNRWQDRVKRFFGSPVKPPAALSEFIPALAEIESEVAKLSTDALNLQERWLFEPMGRWSRKPLWFYIYQVQAYGRAPERCREVIDLLKHFGADMRDLYEQPELLGCFDRCAGDAAFVELQRARERYAREWSERVRGSAIEAIKAGGGQIYPSREGCHWSSSPDGPRLDFGSKNTVDELTVAGLLNRGLLEKLPDSGKQPDWRKSAYRLMSAVTSQ
jgi:hypothetical protein